MIARVLAVLLLCAGILCLQQAPRAQVPMTGAGVGTPKTPFGLSFITKNSNGTAASSFTYTAQSLGAADATRQIAIVSVARQTAAFNISSITVGGVTANSVVNALQASNVQCVIYLASVPTGATGDVVVNYTASVLRNEIAVYRIVGTGVVSGTTATDTTNLTIPTATISVPANSGTIAASGSFFNAASATASNLTQDVNETIAGSTTLFESGNNTSASGSTTFSFTYNVTQNANGSAAAFANFHQ